MNHSPNIEVISYTDNRQRNLNIEIIVDNCIVQTIGLPVDQLVSHRELIAQAARMSIALNPQAYSTSPSSN